MVLDEIKSKEYYLGVQDNKKPLLKILLGVGLGLLLLIIIFRAFSPNYVVISGNIQYNGITPDDPTIGKVVLLAKEPGDSDFKTVNNNIPLEDQAFWHWDQASEGVTYQLKAYVEVDGQRIADSSTITVTAPSVDQVLIFNVTAEDLPMSLLIGSPATISGQVDLNGYIPPGSTIALYGKEKGAQDFVPGATGLAAVDGTQVSWDGAKTGTSYTFYGTLIGPDGAEIGSSEEVIVVAPAANQRIRIDSTVKPPDEIVNISGTVRLNGSTQPNSTILLLQRKPGEGNYHAFDRIPAVNNSRWTFDEAVSGAEYEITASLQVNEVNTTSGNVIRVTAPAANEVITIDSMFSLNPPTQAPQAVCTGRSEGSSSWNVVLTFPVIKDATQYWVEAGRSQGARDILGQRVDAGSSPVQRNIVVEENATTYSRYAYAFNSSCREEQCFSSYSPTLTFKCPQ